jgi:hypothetical protein
MDVPRPKTLYELSDNEGEAQDVRVLSGLIWLKTGHSRGLLWALGLRLSERWLRTALFSEDVGSKFLRNFGELPLDYTAASHLKRQCTLQRPKSLVSIKQSGYLDQLIWSFPRIKLVALGKFRFSLLANPPPLFPPKECRPLYLPQTLSPHWQAPERSTTPHYGLIDHSLKGDPCDQST